MLTVAGGKLTTYRRIALSALERLRPGLGLPRFDSRALSLPGAVGLEDAGRRIAQRFPELDPATRSHLLHLYGSLAEEVLEPALREPSLLEPIHSGGPDVQAQIPYAREQEWAVGVEDVVWRRTQMRSSLEIAQAAPLRPIRRSPPRRAGPRRGRAVRPLEGEDRPRPCSSASRDGRTGS